MRQKMSTYLDNFYPSFPEKEDKSKLLILPKLNQSVQLQTNISTHRKYLKDKRCTMLCKCMSGTVRMSVSINSVSKTQRKKMT